MSLECRKKVKAHTRGGGAGKCGAVVEQGKHSPYLYFSPGQFSNIKPGRGGVMVLDADTMGWPTPKLKFIIMLLSDNSGKQGNISSYCELRTPE